MFLTKRLALTGLSLGLLTALGAVAQAQQPQPSTQNPAAGTETARPFGPQRGRGFRRGSGPGGGFGPRVLRELNLTDAQKQQVHSIIQQNFAGNKAVRDELRQLGEKRRQGTLTSDDQARLRVLHEQMRASMKDSKTKIGALLTADQKTKVEELRKERRANHERFGGRRRGFRGQPSQANPPTQKPAQQP